MLIFFLQNFTSLNRNTLRKIEFLHIFISYTIKLYFQVNNYHHESNEPRLQCISRYHKREIFLTHEKHSQNYFNVSCIEII